MNITSTSGAGNYPLNVWLNRFIDNQPTITSTGTGVLNLCHNNEGNLYEEQLTVQQGDCGQANITYPVNKTNHTNADWIMNITHLRQSSQSTITYYIYYRINNTGTWNSIASNTSLSEIWDYEDIGNTENETNITLLITTVDRDWETVLFIL